VTVAAGATTATFSITTLGVSAATAVTITGTYNGTRTATLTVNSAALTSVVMSPTAVTGGNSSTGTVTLTGVAADRWCRRHAFGQQRQFDDPGQRHGRRGHHKCDVPGDDDPGERG